MVSARALESEKIAIQHEAPFCRQWLTLENLINVGWLDDNDSPIYGTLTTPLLVSCAVVPLPRGLPQGRRFAEIPDDMKEKVISGVWSRVNIWVSLKVRFTLRNCHLNWALDTDEWYDHQPGGCRVAAIFRQTHLLDVSPELGRVAKAAVKR